MMVMMMSDDGQQKDEETFKIIQHMCVCLCTAVHQSVRQSVCQSVCAPPKEGQGCLMSHSCLESQGCHLVPLSYLLSYFFCLVFLLFLSCHFSANGPFF